jgi:Zn-dependent M16 (insulinase) family peptidase
MKLRVLIGSVRCDDSTYGVGQTFNIDEKQGLSLIQAGVVEEVKKEEKKLVEAEEKKEVKKEVEEKKEEKKEPEVKAEPSLEWTRSELNEYANSLGVESPEKMSSKSKVLKAIKGVK